MDDRQYPQLRTRCRLIVHVVHVPRHSPHMPSSLWKGANDADSWVGPSNAGLVPIGGIPLRFLGDAIEHVSEDVPQRAVPIGVLRTTTP